MGPYQERIQAGARYRQVSRVSFLGIISFRTIRTVRRDLCKLMRGGFRACAQGCDSMVYFSQS
jgi:hypothetical protein